MVWGRDQGAVRDVSLRLAEALRDACGGRRGWEVLGPCDCLRARAKDQHRRHVLVKSPLGSEPGPVLSACARDAAPPRGINIAVDIDAHDMM